MGRGPDEHGGIRFQLRSHNNADHPHHAQNTLGVKWAETIGDPNCPLMKRWVIETPAGSLRLHHFLHSDDARALHDHPWWFITFPLGKGYWDLTHCRCKERLGYVETGHRIESGVCVERERTWVPPWRFTYRPALHQHAVETDGCWTLILTGRKLRHWGFWAPEMEWIAGWGNGVRRFFESRKYFQFFGHAPCED